MYEGTSNVIQNCTILGMWSTGGTMPFRKAVKIYTLLWETNWAQFCERLSPGIDFKESIPLTYVAWRAGTITLIAESARQVT